MPPEKVQPRTLRKAPVASQPRNIRSAPSARAKAAAPRATQSRPRLALPKFGEWPSRFGHYLGGVFGGQSLLFSRIFGAMFLLVTYGLIMVLSASSIDSIKQYHNPLITFSHQAIFATGGLAGLIFASTRTVDWYYRASSRLFLITLAFQLAAVIPGIGHSVNGNREWISLPFGFTLQPSEFVKLALIISLSVLLTMREDQIFNARHYTFGALKLVGVAAGLIIAGSDMGTTLVVLLFSMVVIWLSGAPNEHLRPWLILGIGGAIIGLFSTSSRIGRIMAWAAQSTSDNQNLFDWQSVHGVWALANAHIIGQGLGMSSLKWSWIPEVENDYIFAIIGEELGIVGAIATIAIFLLLGYWIVQVGLRSRDRFGRLVSFGVASWIVLQAMINIAVVLRILPVLGVPLPLISSGGSSLVADMAAIGVVLAIERRNHIELDGGQRRPVRTTL